MTESEFNAKYPWVKAYEALAIKLKEKYDSLSTKEKDEANYSSIVKTVKEAFAKAGVGYYPLAFKGNRPSDNDIDPFSIFGFFNNVSNIVERRNVASKIMEKFEVEVDGKCPSFENEEFFGIPIFAVRKVINFDIHNKEKNKRLWDLFCKILAPSPYGDDVAELISDIEKNNKISGFTPKRIYLFWVQPRKFLSLDGKSTQFSRFREYVGCDPEELKKAPATYLAKCEELANASTKGLPFRSFVEFSDAAQEESEGKKHGNPTDNLKTTGADQTTGSQAKSPAPSDSDKISKLSSVLFNALSECEKVPEFMLLAKDIPAFLRERQKIWFGAPGTGKSFKVNELAKSLEKNGGQYFRTTFHPDYDYATFVGCYKPYSDEKDNKEITYKFIPQVFTKAYVAAWNSWMLEEPKPVVLVIEEINRGNCAQIFGQIFQLLDRNESGYSEYPVTMDQDLQHYLLGEIKDDASYEENGKLVLLAVDEKEKGGKLVLPPNFFIFATMNTSDQSLFPMDSAFKRRWDWEYVPIDCSNGTENWKITIGDKNNKYLWKDFLIAINQKILEKLKSADKQLGERFVKAGEDGIIDQKTFVNKVMFYLVGDAFKDDSTIRDICKGDSNDKTEIVFADFADGTNGSDNLKKFFEGLRVNEVP